jgi:hypothetical protein
VFETRDQLVEHAQKGGNVTPGTEDYSIRVSEILQLIVATQEYQFAESTQSSDNLEIRKIQEKNNDFY